MGHHSILCKWDSCYSKHRTLSNQTACTGLGPDPPHQKAVQAQQESIIRWTWLILIKQVPTDFPFLKEVHGNPGGPAPEHVWRSESKPSKGWTLVNSEMCLPGPLQGRTATQLWGAQRTHSCSCKLRHGPSQQQRVPCSRSCCSWGRSHGVTDRGRAV